MSVSGLYPVNGNESGVFYNGLYVVAGTVQVPEGSIDPRAIAGAVSGTVFVDLQSAQVINGSKTFTQRIYAAAIQISSGAQAGYFLTCDTFGNASWVALPPIPDDYVDLVSDQVIDGKKTFDEPPVISGNSILTATIPIVSVIGTAVDCTTNQSVSGQKTFNTAPIQSGAGILPGTIATTAVSGTAIVSTGAQSISGLKTFTQGPNMPGNNITTGTIAQTAIVGGTSLISNNPNNSNNQGLTGGWAIQNYLQVNQVVQAFSTTVTGFTGGVLTVDYSLNGVYNYVLASNTNFTVNIINIPATMVTATTNKAFTITLILDTTSFKAYATAVQLNGVPYTLQFAGGASNVIIGNATAAGYIEQRIVVYYTGAFPVPYKVGSSVAVCY